MTLSMFHICKKRLLLYYITYTKVKRFKVKKKRKQRREEEERRKRKGKGGKKREQECTYMHASTAVDNFPIRDLERVGDNQVISHIRFKKLVIAGDKDPR